jgi:hypothetical protein
MPLRSPVSGEPMGDVMLGCTALKRLIQDFVGDKRNVLLQQGYLAESVELSCS